MVSVKIIARPSLQSREQVAQVAARVEHTTPIQIYNLTLCSVHCYRALLLCRFEDLIFTTLSIAKIIRAS